MKIINSLGLEKDLGYEPPYTIMWGVDEETTGTKVMTMARTVIPPGGKNRLHYHACDATFYVAKGPIYVYCGGPRNPARHLVEAGHFCHAPAGEVHGQENPSKTEHAELIASFGNCSHRDKSGTVFVDEAPGRAPSPALREGEGAPRSGRAVKIINSLGLEKDLRYEPPYTIMWGVNEETAGTKVMTMQRTIIPPGGKNKLHSHACDATFYVAKGPIYVYCGNPRNPVRHLVEAGHFCYVPAGEVHGQENPSPADYAELIASYGNCPHQDKAGTTFME